MTVFLSKVPAPFLTRRDDFSRGGVTALTELVRAARLSEAGRMRSTVGSLLSAPIWSRVGGRAQSGSFVSRATELAFQASDVGRCSRTRSKPLQHQTPYPRCSAGPVRLASARTQIGRPSASVRISAASGIVRTSTGEDRSRGGFKAAASVNCAPRAEPADGRPPQSSAASCPARAPRPGCRPWRL